MDGLAVIGIMSGKIIELPPAIVGGKIRAKRPPNTAFRMSKGKRESLDATESISSTWISDNRAKQ